MTDKEKQNIKNCRKELQNHFDSTGKWYKGNVLDLDDEREEVFIRRDYFCYYNGNQSFVDKWYENTKSRLKYDKLLFEVISPILKTHKIDRVIISDCGISTENTFTYTKSSTDGTWELSS